MIEVTSVDAKTNGVGRIGSQPIALAGAALVIIMLGVGSIAVWRTYTGTSPEQDRIAAARQSQARVAQTSEQLVEKTKGLEASQEESIDQLQVVQDQLQTVKRLLASQQTDTKRLSDQVGELSGAIDSLRQSFASIPSAEASNSRPARHASTRNKVPPDKGRASQNRQIARLTALQTGLQMPVCSMQLSENRIRFFAPFVKWITSARTAGRLDAVHRMA